MGNCVKCGNIADHHFKAVEVHTFSVRGMKGVQRVQALGPDREFDVCEKCAREKLSRIVRPDRSFIRRCIVFGAIGLLGIVLTVLFWKGAGALRLLGLGAVACCVMGLWGTVSDYKNSKKEYTVLSEEKAVYRAAWDCVVEFAPKKYGDNDITYIPVNKETLARKNGDLMILYDLLPEIAIQAYNRIHGIHKDK